MLNPTAGATVELSERVHLGLEGWMRAELEDEDEEARGRVPSTWAPLLRRPRGDAQLRHAVVDYGRLLARRDPGRTTQVGDAYGPLWVRTVVGIGF